jgi:hypothetical protein
MMTRTRLLALTILLGLAATVGEAEARPVPIPLIYGEAGPDAAHPRAVHLIAMLYGGHMGRARASS